jgi:hypothetical protein
MSIRTSWLRLLKVVHRALLWCDRRMPRGTRGAAGLVLVGLAPFGFLPVLGFWMLPLGLMLLAVDVSPIRPTVSAALIRMRRRASVFWRKRVRSR